MLLPQLILLKLQNFVHAQNDDLQVIYWLLGAVTEYDVTNCGRDGRRVDWLLLMGEWHMHANVPAFQIELCCGPWFHYFHGAPFLVLLVLLRQVSCVFDADFDSSVHFVCNLKRLNFSVLNFVMYAQCVKHKRSNIKTFFFFFFKYPVGFKSNLKNELWCSVTWLFKVWVYITFSFSWKFKDLTTAEQNHCLCLWNLFQFYIKSTWHFRYIYIYIWIL